MELGVSVSSENLLDGKALSTAGMVTRIVDLDVRMHVINEFEGKINGKLALIEKGQTACVKSE
jgi:hypothetical protein